MKRNGWIELLRFIAAISIAAYHFEWVYIGKPILFSHFYIWVEFFFVLSGFFVAKSAIENEAIGSFKYTWKELKKLYPMYFFAFFITFGIYCLENALSRKDALILLWQTKWEVMLASMFGFDNSAVVINRGGAPAYISALLVASLIIYFFIQKERNIFLHVIAPLVVILGYSRILYVYGNLSQWFSYDGFMEAGLLRAFCGMSAGALFYLILPHVLKRKKKKEQLAYGVVCILFILGLVLFRNHITFSDLVIYVLVFGVLISILYVIDLKINVKCNNMLIQLGSYAYPIFLIQWATLSLLKMYLPNRAYSKMFFLYFLLCLLFAVILKEISKVWNICIERIMLHMK